jgi:hypothetical protein
VSRGHRTVSAAVVAALALGAAACGDDDDGDTPQPAGTSTPASQPAGGGVPLQPGSNISTPNTYGLPGATSDVANQVTDSSVQSTAGGG